jgi:hypothetical protein
MSTDPKYFNANKLGQVGTGRRTTTLDDPDTPDVNEGGQVVHERFYTDGSDAMANKGFVVGFHHVPSGKEVYLKAFMTAYNETFSPDWAEEKVYGRADPIYLFKQTTRVITVGIKIPAASAGEAFENLSRIQSLTQFLYPTYVDVQSASTIAQSPLIRLQVMNLAQSHSDEAAWWHHGAEGAWEGESFPLLANSVDAKYGLLGVLRNLSIVHNLEGPDGVIEAAKGVILPKLIDINFDFAVIHEHALGWDEDSNFSNKAFPYGVKMGGAKTAEQLRELEIEGAKAFTRAQAEQREAETLAEQREQDVANAEARYVGMFGNMRSNRDQRRLDRGEARALSGGELSENRTSRLDYLASAQRGAEIIDETGE